MMDGLETQYQRAQSQGPYTIDRLEERWAEERAADDPSYSVETGPLPITVSYFLGFHVLSTAQDNLIRLTGRSNPRTTYL